MATQDDFDPRKNNIGNYQNGTRVRAKMLDETREGVIVKQVDDRNFLIKLDSGFFWTNRGKPWLTVCRDYAHESVTELS